MVTNNCVIEIKNLSADSLVGIGALRRVEGKDGEYVCPFCNNGGNGTKNPTGIKPKDYYSHVGWKCHRCGEKFDNISILAAHYGLHYRNDFEEICRRACEDFGISFEVENYNMNRGDYNMHKHQRKAIVPNSGNTKLIYSSKADTSEPTSTTPPIKHSERGIIIEQLATDETALENFVNSLGGYWRGLPLEILKKHNCRFIKNWLAPSLLAKHPDAVKWATTSPRMLIPADTDQTRANYLARLTVPIENFTDKQQRYIREKDHAGAKTLFNIEVLKNTKEVFAVEGEIDAMSIELAGFKAVALGSAESYGLLVKAVATLETKPKVLILLDPDDVGKKHAQKLKNELTKIGCCAVIQFLSETNSETDANSILQEHGVDYLMNELFAIQQSAQKEFQALEKEVATLAPMTDRQISLTSDQCKILFEDGNNALANARRLEYLFGDRLRYLQDCDRWLTYSNGLWSKAPKSQNACLYPFVIQASEILKANAADDEEEKIAAVFKKKTIRDSFAFLKGLESVIIKQADLDNHPQLLNCLNGVIDLETGILMQADPKLLLTQQCNAAFTGKRDATVDKFLRDILPDEETRAAFIRWLAYCLTGEVSEEKAFLFYGSGGNGKGTATLLLMNLFADYATSLPITAVCEAGRLSDAGAATTELNVLEKRRLAIVEELPQGRKLDTAKFKLLTGGDKIPIRRLHEEFTMINPTHKIIISGNYRPELTDARDPGLIRRIHSVDFLQNFTGTNRDEHLKKKLLAPDALSGLLTLLVADAVQWYKHGLIFSAGIEKSTRNYFDQNDFISAFISEFCDYGYGRFIELNTFVKRLKDEYPDETRLISDRHLKDMIKKLDGKNAVEYRRVGEKSRYGLAGIGFKGGSQQQSFDDFQGKTTKSSDAPLPFDPDDIPFE